MNTEKLERGNVLAKSLIPKVDVLLSMSPKVTVVNLQMLFGNYHCLIWNLMLNSSSFRYETKAEMLRKSLMSFSN